MVAPGCCAIKSRKALDEGAVGAPGLAKSLRIASASAKGAVTKVAAIRICSFGPALAAGGFFDGLWEITTVPAASNTIPAATIEAVVFHVIKCNAPLAGVRVEPPAVAPLASAAASAVFIRA